MLARRRNTSRSCWPTVSAARPSTTGELVRWSASGCSSCSPSRRKLRTPITAWVPMTKSCLWMTTSGALVGYRECTGDLSGASSSAISARAPRRVVVVHAASVPQRDVARIILERTTRCCDREEHEQANHNSQDTAHEPDQKTLHTGLWVINRKVSVMPR